MRCRGSDRKRSTYPNKSKFIKKDKEGVASVVGTIMALLIFLTLLTLFVNTWMPVTLKEHERTHMEDVMNEFGTMKGSLDNMVIYTRLSGFPSFPVHQSIDLGAEGIPAFASATAGLLTLNPNSTDESRSYANFTEGNDKICLSGGGSIEFYAPNRYYVQQWVAYENGAIILKQEDGQITRAKPGVSFTYDSGALNVNFYQMSFFGQSTSTSGTDSTGLNMEVIAVDQAVYNPEGGEYVTFEFITKYGQAYYDYFNNTLSDMIGLPNGGSAGWSYTDENTYHYRNIPGGPTGLAVYWQVSLEYLSQYDCYRVVLTMQNPTTAVSSISYSHAYVNFEITK